MISFTFSRAAALAAALLLALFTVGTLFSPLAASMVIGILAEAGAEVTRVYSEHIGLPLDVLVVLLLFFMFYLKMLVET